MLELVFFYQDCVDKIINKINKKYIHDKSNDNTENTKVNVYNRKYKETYNRKGAL